MSWACFFYRITVLQIRLTIKYFDSTDFCKNQENESQIQIFALELPSVSLPVRTKQSKRANKEGGPTKKKEEEEAAKRDERENGCLS